MTHTSKEPHNATPTNVVGELKTPYEAGYDSVINGADSNNCNFKWFNTPENTQEWERGVKEAKAKGNSK